MLMGRLFPFQRGLSHAYWAPNVWALYNALDKVLFVFLKKILKSRVLNFSSMTRGIIGDIVHLVLPSIRSHHTAILTIASMAPVLISVYRRPFPKTFLAAANYCTMCSFMLGWHVHEKAILMVILPLGMEALKSKFYFDFFTFFTTLSSFSLFPLLHEPQELPVKILILVLYHILVLSIARHRVMAKLKTRRTQTPPFGFLRMAYLCGFVPIQLFTLIQPWIFKTWEFLPLLVTSVYCSFGMLYAWKKTWDIYWLEYRLAMELYQE